MNDECHCIRLWDCLLVPFQGEVGDDQAQQITAEILFRIKTQHCANVLLDLSGVGTLDSHLCAKLVQLARAARMMGAQTVISGMRPEIAMTLEAMGIRLKDMLTVATLEDALERLGIGRLGRSDGVKPSATHEDHRFLMEPVPSPKDRALFNSSPPAAPAPSASNKFPSYQKEESL